MFFITKSHVAYGTAERICFCISVTVWSPDFTLWEHVCLDGAVFNVIAVSQCENVMYLLWITCHNILLVAMRTEWNIYNLCAICGKMSFSSKNWNSEVNETLSCHHSHYILWSVVCFCDGLVNWSFIEKTSVIEDPTQSVFKISLLIYQWLFLKYQKVWLFHSFLLWYTYRLLKSLSCLYPKSLVITCCILL